MSNTSNKAGSNAPVVLFIGGHDPSGGAGLQADLETASRFDCRAISLVTCLTAQNSRDVVAIHPQNRENFREQAQTLLSDIRPDVIKIGLLGDRDIAETSAQILKDLGCPTGTPIPPIPIVLDPVLAAGGGNRLASEQIEQVIREQFLPITFLLTPNQAEARCLAESDDEKAPHRLLQLGCEHVLVTGADEAHDDKVSNRLYSASNHPESQRRQTYEWPLLPHVYHGSGCTLASACACGLARGETLEQAVLAAQEFTREALLLAEHPGEKQWFPNRRSPR